MLANGTRSGFALRVQRIHLIQICLHIRDTLQQHTILLQQLFTVIVKAIPFYLQLLLVKNGPGSKLHIFFHAASKLTCSIEELFF